MNPPAWLSGLAARSELPLLAALAMGLLAAIGPCPLATNVSAVGYMAQQFRVRSAVVASGVLYAAGRSLSYGLVGLVALGTGAQLSRLAAGLQTASDVWLGPLLLGVGLVLADVVRIPLPAGGPDLAPFRARLARLGFLGSFGLGFLFALAFCPYTATLFFLLLVPLAIQASHGWLLPLVFGVATAIPVMVLAIPLALGLERAARALADVARIERLTRRLAGLLFIAAGALSLWRLVQTYLG